MFIFWKIWTYKASKIHDQIHQSKCGLGHLIGVNDLFCRGRFGLSIILSHIQTYRQIYNREAEGPAGPDLMSELLKVLLG